MSRESIDYKWIDIILCSSSCTLKNVTPVFLSYCMDGLFGSDKLRGWEQLYHTLSKFGIIGCWFIVFSLLDIYPSPQENF